MFLKKFTSQLYKHAKKVYFTWFISYVSILLVPVIISSIVYFESVKNLQQEFNQSNLSMLTQLQQVIDDQLKTSQKLSIQIALNTNLQNLINLTGTPQSNDLYTVSQILKDFSAFTITSDFIEDFFVVFKNSDLVITKDSRHYKDTFYDLFLKDSGIPLSEWMNFPVSSSPIKYAPSTYRQSDGKVVTTLSYIQSLPITESLLPKAAIFIMLDREKLQKAVQAVTGINNGMVFIIDKKDDILISTHSNNMEKQVKYSRMKENNGTLEEKLNGQPYVMSYIQSEITSWKYVTAVPASLYNQKVQYIKNLTIVCFVLCLTLGALIAWLLSKLNYNPLQQIIQQVSGMVGISTDTGYDEYRFIREAITHTYHAKDTAEKKLELQNNLLKTNFLAKMIKGKLDDTVSVEDALSSFKLQLKSDLFAVILFYIEDYDKLFEGSEKKSSDEKVKLVQFIITNIVEELSSEVNQGIVVEIDDMMTCLINFDPSIEGHEIDEIQKLAKKVQHILAEKFYIHVTIGFSSVHSSYVSIPQAYHEALQALEYKIIMGSNEIISYEAISPKHPKSLKYNYPTEVEQQLINFTRSGDYSKANALIGEIISNNFDSELTSIKMAKCLMFDLTSTIIKTLNDSNIIWDDTFFDQLDPIERLFNCKSVKEMEHEMTSILFSVCEYINKNKKSHNDVLKDKVIEIVDANYHKESLGLAEIANQLNVNASYLSKYFKEQTGTGLLDYINKARIEKAKSLLNNTGTSIADIAKLTGYSNSTTFIRVFKKYEGVTPGQYKDMSSS